MQKSSDGFAQACPRDDLLPRSGFMRRNLALRLLFALALVVQAFAPAAANVIQSARAGAGKTSFQLCLKSAPDFVNGENRQPGAPWRHGENCFFCQLACEGAAPIVAVSINAGATPVLRRTSAWSITDRAFSTPRFDTSNQPRAPPILS